VPSSSGIAVGNRKHFSTLRQLDLQASPKGRHLAGLNFGDCFAYALAKVTGEPLLFKGRDFKRTDITSALEGGN